MTHRLIVIDPRVGPKYVRQYYYVTYEMPHVCVSGTFRCLIASLYNQWYIICIL